MTVLTGSKLSYSQERFEDVFFEALPLLEEHQRELEGETGLKLDVDLDAYFAAEQHGILRIYTVRQDRVVIGYAVFFVRPAPHYVHSLQAAQDVVYLSPEHRKGRIGIQLLQYAEASLRSEGVEVIFHHVKIAHCALAVILERMGYQAKETVYSKRLA